MDKGSRTWEEVKRTGRLTSNIKNIDDYTQQWDINQNNVDDYLDSLPISQEYLTSKDFLEIHRLSFQDIHTFAGELTKKQTMFGSYPGAPPSMIKEEFKLLDKQMEELWSKAQTPDAKTAALAFQHIRFVGIHAMPDGNGRTSRKALGYGMNRVHGAFQVNQVQRADYIKANNAGLEHNNIGRLAHVISEDYLLSYSGHDQQTSPYQVRAFQEKVPSVNEAYNLSTIQAPENINPHLSTSKNYWIKPFDLEDLLRNSNGKQAANYEEESRKFNLAVKRPLSIGETVELIKFFKDSGAIKKKFLTTLNTQVYTDLLKKRLAPAVQFLEPQQKEGFLNYIERHYHGFSKVNETDKLHKNISKAKVNLKSQREIRDRLDPPRVISLKERGTKNLNNDQSQKRSL
jgi:fido (protein-threonine AMPylation protein)